MPALSFSDVKFVRDILKGRKTQTIRPLGIETGWTTSQIYKKPYLKKGDVVKFYFKQRSTPKDSWFCLKCGTQSFDGRGIGHYCPNEKCDVLDGPEQFPKHFATVKITEVFEIDMYYDEGVGGYISPDYNFANRDGFKNLGDVLIWFHKKYDLSEGRRFVVYRWRKLIKGD